ncbi:MAG: group II intron reverse transcriptase/maturase [Oligoflexia bacterium]|nr:group II intron reverse transcriptase/maturase [Oligoflexia bacterium]
MQTKLNLISELVKRDEKCRVNNVAYLLGEESLKECFGMLKRGKAAGIDGVSVEEYGKNLDANVAALVARMKAQSYKPQPVRRSYIAKANGKERALGIPSVEDKIVQRGIVRILESIYEVDFLDFSYGFRPHRSCHQALKQLNQVIMMNPINHVIDADIKGFFDNVDHEWMMKFLSVRINDPALLRLIKRFLKNGYMEEGKLHATDEGTPQGGVISPILANIYLHYVLDLWMQKVVKRNCRGVVEMIRYADDFIICVQYKDDAIKIREALTARLKKFNLELSEEKTRVIEFGRFAKQNAHSKEQRPATFNFLGFTHFIDRTKKNTFKLGRKTDRKKFTAKITEMNLWLKNSRNLYQLEVIWKILKAKLRGHFQYYGVSGNYRSINDFNSTVKRLVFKWLNRRSQKKSFNLEGYSLYLKRHPLPTPAIHHNFYTGFSST